MGGSRLLRRASHRLFVLRNNAGHSVYREHANGNPWSARTRDGGVPERHDFRGTFYAAHLCRYGDDHLFRRANRRKRRAEIKCSAYNAENASFPYYFITARLKRSSFILIQEKGSAWEK